MRRSPIRRVSGLVRRTGLAPMSRRRAAGAATRAEIRRTVFERDGRCMLDVPHNCWGPLTFHHLLKASQGGRYDAENGLALCAAANVWVEDNPAEADRLGLVRHVWDDREDDCRG